MQLLHWVDEPPIPNMGTGSPQYCLRWNNHRTNLLSAFESLLRQEAFTDVTLACEEGVTLHAHRLVLAACSTYFSTLFSSTHNAQHPIIVLKDVKAEDMRAILDYMYRGEVNVAQGALEGLLALAKGLKVKGLIEDPTTDSYPIPLVTHSQGLTSKGLNLSKLNPSPVSSTDTRVSSTERKPLPDLHFNPTPNRVPSPLPIPQSQQLRPPPVPSSISPKRTRVDSPKDKPLHINLPSPLPFVPTSYYPRILPSFDHRIHPPNLIEDKDISSNQKDTLETATEVSSRPERPPRPASDDPRHDNRRQSPMPPLLNTFQPQHYHRQECSSPPVKRPRQYEPLISPTPILRTALAHTPGFNPDVSSLVSLANSMMPLSPLLTSKPPGLLPQDIVRRSYDPRDQIETPFNLMLPKKSEPLSDDDSRLQSDIPEDDSSDRTSNGTLVPNLTNYSMDLSNQSHYSNFVSYVPTPKPEWKRYKQYTKTDLMEAIDAVRSGMTALQASRRYKVPSRTLYDKIKKMGISTVPRRIPNKRTIPGSGDPSQDCPSLEARPHSAGPFEQLSISRDYYDQRPCSIEAQNEPSSLPSLPVHTPSSGADEVIKKEPRSPYKNEPQEDSPPEPSTTRGSFSLVGRKVFPSGETAPLDLTEPDSLIPNRQQLEERA